MLHTHSFIYHQRCIKFFSQHFSFPCQYHSTNAPYSFIHLPPTLYKVFLPVFQISPVSFIRPMLHTHSFTHNRSCTMFFSQYFSFPCQYHSTNAPYSFIHLPSTLYNVFLPVLQFFPVRILSITIQNHHNRNTALIRTSGQSLRTLKTENVLSYIEEQGSSFTKMITGMKTIGITWSAEVDRIESLPLMPSHWAIREQEHDTVTLLEAP